MKKVVEWVKKSGLSNLGYVGGGIALFIFNHVNFAFALWGIAVYLNYNVIRKLITNAIKK